MTRVGLLVAFVLVAICTSTAYAHALLLRSDPGTGVAVSTAPHQVSLWFSEPVGVERNAIAVLDAGGRRVDRLDAHVADDDPHRIDTTLMDIADGSYVVRWQVASVDNHVVQGTTWFAVGFAVSPPDVAALVGSGAPTLSGAEVVGRWLVYLAVLYLVGAPLFALLVLSDRPAGRPMFGAAAVLGLGQLVWLAAQAEAVAGTGLAQAISPGVLAVVLSSRFGVLWLLRLAAAAGIVATLQRSRRLMLVGSLALLASLSLGAHASAGPLPSALGVPLDMLHLAAASLWLGGLAYFLLARRKHVDVRRVSNVALGSVVVLLLTGASSAIAQVGTSVFALFSTAYGQMLLIKVGLVVLVLVFGARNLLAARRPSPTTSRRFIFAEISIGVAVLAAAAGLTSLPSPEQQPLPAPVDVARQASDADLRISLHVDPNWVGVSQFVVSLQDGTGRPPADVQAVTLTFAMQGMNMGRTNVAARPASDGTYAASGYFVGMPGISEVGVAVQRSGRPDSSATFLVEVPDVTETRFDGLRPALGVRTVNPIAADAASLQRGQTLYQANCEICHGATGVGDGPSAGALRPPPADLTVHARWHGDPQLFWYVTHGVSGTAMPAFSDVLSDQDRWSVINYLHVLAQASTATVQVAPVTPTQTPPLEPTAATSATAGGPLTGKLVYGPDTDHDFWIIDMPDGSPRKITAFGALDFPSSPAWSPSGRSIAYGFYQLPANARIPLPPGTDIYVMNSDGSNAHSVAVHDVPGAILQNPNWIADESSLVVSYQGTRPDGGQDIGIDRVDLSSGTRRRIIRNAIAPAVSRDGNLLAYAQLPSSTVRGFTLWRSNIDGSNPVQLVGELRFTRFEGARFSPDGRHVVFAAVGNGQGGAASDPLDLVGRLFSVPPAYADGDLWDIWMVDIDGGNLRRLTSINEDLPTLAWSPDGSAVAFLGGGSTVTAEAGVSVLDASGTGAAVPLARLTRQPGHRGLDWTRR